MEENTGNTNNIIEVGSGNIITALFNNPRSGAIAYQALLAKGYNQADISVAVSEDTRANYFSDINNADGVNFGNKSLEGLGVGAAVGGSLGAIAAALAAVGTSLVIPGLGIIVAGSLAASLAGAGAGAASGGLIGTFIGLGIPDEKAKILEEGIKTGGVVLSLKAKSEEDLQDIKKIWTQPPLSQEVQAA